MSESAKTSAQIKNSASTSEHNKSETVNTLDKFKLKDNVTKAETIWCLHTVIQHSSLRDAKASVPIFKKRLQIVLLRKK